MGKPFDPGAPAAPDSGLFGLTDRPELADVHVIGVPFDATASYRKGAWRGPEAILRASHQIDLHDLLTGDPWQAGIWMHPPDPEIAAWNEEATALAEGGSSAADRARVNVLGAEVNARVLARVDTILAEGRLPAVVGGDHSTPFGAIEACAKHYADEGLGVLHFDAHADLRHAYEGFEWSHASILENVLRRLPGVSQVVQVGIRDVCAEELDLIRASEGRVYTLFDHEWANARLEGRDLRALIRKHIAHLPKHVFVTFDVDGLDPTLCPNTGTPVPGGLIWHETMLWLEELARSGCTVVGLDVNEVNPGPAGPDEDSWDAIVGARLLYRMIGFALKTRDARNQRHPGP